MYFQLVSIAANSNEKNRLQSLCQDLGYSNSHFSVDEFVENQPQFESSPKCIVICASSVTKQEEISGMVQVAKQMCPESFIVTIIGKKMTPEHAAFVKKSGSQMVLLENNLMESSYLEYVAAQAIRGDFLPVKPAEFLVNTSLNFNLYFMLPLNQKILQLLGHGTVISESRHKKMMEAGELLIRREDVQEYKKYVESNTAHSVSGMLNRCRAQYLHFHFCHSELIFLLIDQSEMNSFQQGKKLYDQCQQLASDLLTSLSAVGDAWEVVNNSSLGEFGTIDRAPSVAAYAGILSLLSSIGDPKDVMISALLADIGMLELPPVIHRKMRQNFGLQSLNSEELKLYHNHPYLSLNQCLARKLQLKDSIRNMVLASHERVDGKGFPNKTIPEKISYEAMLIQFCEMVDQRSMLKMGESKVTASEARKVIFKQCFDSRGIFAFDFLEKIKSNVS